MSGAICIGSGRRTHHLRQRQCESCGLIIDAGGWTIPKHGRRKPKDVRERCMTATVPLRFRPE